MSDTPVCSDSHITLSLALSIALFSLNFALSLPLCISISFFCVYLVSVNICHSLSLLQYHHYYLYLSAMYLPFCLSTMYLSIYLSSYLQCIYLSIYLSIYSVSPSQTYFQLCSLSSVNLLSGPRPHFVLSP